MVNKTKLLLFALVGLSSLAGAADSGVPLSLNDWAGGFTPMFGFSDSSFLWCSNQPTGASCADWVRSCNRVSSVPYGRDRWAYYELTDVVHNGNYDYYSRISEVSPDGRFYQDVWETKGSFPGVSSGGLCNWIQFYGSVVSKPAGKWWHTFEFFDQLTNASPATFDTTFNVTCSSSAECSPGLGCFSGMCAKAPDLTVTDLRVCPAQPIANLTSQFFGYVKNVGSSDVQAFPQARNEFRADNKFENYYEYLYGGLGAGQETTLQTHTRLPDGGHAIDLAVDVNNVVQETNEGNNALRRVWNWLSAKPDFVVSSVELSPSPPVGFESTLLSVTIKEAHGWEVLETVLVNVSIDGELLGVQVPFILPASGITLNYWTMRPAGVHEVKAAIAAPDVVEESVSNNVVVNQVEWLQPVEYSQSLEGVAGEYHVGDVIKAVFSAREKIGTPLAGATVTVRDSFGGSASLTTDSLGLAYYQFNASKSGVHFLEFRTSKNGYFTYWQKQSFKVIDWNARVHVTVHDRWGNPVYKASVARANVTKGTTAKDGTLEFLTDKGYNDVRVYCPDKTPCQSWLPYVENTTFLDVTCSCNLGEPATFVFTSLGGNSPLGSLDGKPIAFVQVVEDGNLLGLTDLNGTLVIPKLTLGPHVVDAYFCFKEEKDDNCSKVMQTGFFINHTFAATYSYRIDYSTLYSPLNVTSIASYKGPGTVLGLSYYSQNTSAQFVFIPVVLAVVWVYFTYNDAMALGECASENRYSMLSSCWGQMAWLFIDFVPGAVLEKGAAKVAAHVGVFVKAGEGVLVPVVRSLPKLGEVRAIRRIGNSEAWQVTTRIGGKAAEYTVWFANGLKKIKYGAIEFVVRLDDEATELLLSSRFGQEALSTWSDAVAQYGLAKILNYGGENAASRIKILCNPDGYYEISRAAGNKVFDPARVEPLVVGNMYHAGQMAGFSIFANDIQSINRIYAAPKGIGLAWARIGGEIGSEKAFQQFPGIVYLVDGIHYKETGGGFGYVHIKEDHWFEFVDRFGIGTDDELKELIGTTIAKMDKLLKNGVWDGKTYIYRMGGEYDIQVIMSTDAPGSIATVFTSKAEVVK